MASLEMLAMLNEPAAKLGMSRGGIPSFVPADVAAGLGYIKTKFGRAILEYLYVESMHFIALETVEKMFAEIMHEEMRRQRTEEQKARLDLQIAKENLEARRRSSTIDLIEMHRLERKHEIAKAQLWPVCADVHVKIRRTVLEELRGKAVCKICNGNSFVLSNLGAKVKCKSCAKSDGKKSREIGRDKSRYSKSWRSVYEFAYQVAKNAHDEAHRQFSEAMKQEAI